MSLFLLAQQWCQSCSEIHFAYPLQPECPRHCCLPHHRRNLQACHPFQAGFVLFFPTQDFHIQVHLNSLRVTAFFFFQENYGMRALFCWLLSNVTFSVPPAFTSTESSQDTSDTSALLYLFHSNITSQLTSDMLGYIFQSNVSLEQSTTLYYCSQMSACNEET